MRDLKIHFCGQEAILANQAGRCKRSKDRAGSSQAQQQAGLRFLSLHVSMLDTTPAKAKAAASLWMKRLVELLRLGTLPAYVRTCS